MTATLQEALNHGARLIQGGDAGAAQALAEQLLERFPDNATVRLFAADAASRLGDVAQAFERLDGIPAAAPEYPRALVRRARLLFADGRRADALALTREVADRVADDPGLLRGLAGVLRDCQAVEEAHAWLERALRLAPGAPDVLYDLAVAEYHLNRPEEAEAHIEELLAAAPLHGPALHLRSALRTQSEDRHHVDDLRQRLARGAQQPRLVAAANYALAKELEDLGRHDEAADALDAGARAQRSTLSYDLEAELAAHDGIREAFGRDTLASLAPGYGGERPVFVVGMPRTGTTLVERMLAGHSALVSIGEFQEFPRLYGIALQRQVAANPGVAPAKASLGIDFAALGRDYARAARELAGESPGFVDKLPYNFLYCGYILAALPEARLIHLTRHPLDTCYAVYKTLFTGAYGFSYDLDELGRYYLSYRRLMDHWHEVLPGRILDVAYEDLVRDPEPQARRMVDWCGLDWEPAVLDFHRQQTPSMTASAMQVRQPVHTDSIGSWRRAGDRLAGLEARFAAAGIL